MTFQYTIPLPFYIMLAPEHVFELEIAPDKVVKIQFQSPTEMAIPPAPRTNLTVYSNEELEIDELNRVRLYVNALIRAYRILTKETYNNGVIRPIPHDAFFRIVIRQELDDQGHPVGPRPRIMQYIQRLRLGVISQEQYEKLRQLSQSPDTLQRYLIDELLLGAKSFFQEENYRMAVLEAVIALDIVVSSLVRKIGRSRGISTGNLKNFVKEVGLERSLKVVLKLLIPDALPNEAVLTGCKAANSVRNKIVHEGRLNVSENEAIEAIQHIQTFVEQVRGL